MGVDNSPEMIERGAGAGPPAPALSFVLADVRDWQPERPVDVLVSNAVLQWVPGHLEVVRRLARHAGARRLAGLPATR